MTRPGQNIEDLNPLKQKQAQITIKQAPAPDKTNKQKQKNHSKEELQEARVSYYTFDIWRCTANRS